MFRGLRGDGVNAVVLDVRRLRRMRHSIRRFDALRRLAAREGLMLVAAVPRAHGSALGHQVRAMCARHARALRCASLANSTASAVALGRGDRLAAVVVSGPSGFARYAALTGLRQHLLVVVKLSGRFDPWVWSDVLGRAETSPSADLGVAPQTSLTSQPVKQYLSAMSSSRRTGVAAPSNLATSNAAQRSVTLSWTDSSTNIAGYRLYRGGKQVGTSASTDYAYGGLSCGTSYSLGVAAYTTDGQASTVTKTNAATSACVDTTPPSLPTSLATTNVGQSSITLSWHSSTDDVGVAGYRLYVDGVAVGTTTGTSFSFTGLACWTKPGDGVYSLGVSAYDAAGNASAVATTAQQTQQCAGSAPPPSTPTGLATSNAGQTSITLSWNPSTSSLGLAGYQLSRDGTQVGTSSTTSSTFTGLACGTSYTLGVTAVDVGGGVSGTATLAGQTLACPGDTSPPSTPTGVAPTDVEQTSVTLGWTSSTDNVGVTGYRVYQDGVQIGTTSTTSFTFGSLACSTGSGTAVYTFGVAAFDAAGNVSSTQSVNQETLPCGSGDTAPPSTPTGLGVSNVTASSMSLSWSPSTDNVGVTGYLLYRNGAQVGTTSGTSYAFTGLACGTTYTLAVAATDAAGNTSSPASTPGTTTPCSGGGGSGTANLWVDTSGGTCTRSATPAAYADAAACGSFNAAYQAAQPGDTVVIKGGSYGAQTIAVSTAKTNASADVVMSVESGATATLNGALIDYGSHLVLRGESAANRSLKVPYYSIEVDPVGGAQVGSNRTNHVTVQYAAGANFQVGPATYVTLDSNDWGPSIACNSNYPSSQTEDQISWDGNYSGVVPDHVTLSNNLIHDMNSDNTLSCHMGGLNIQGFNALTITGNKFFRNAIYDIEFDEFTGTQAVSGLVMENNWFGPPVGTNDHRNGTSPSYGDPGQADVQVKWDGHAASDWLVAFNSFSQGFAPEWGGAPPSYSNVRVLANLGGTITNGGWLFCSAYGKTGVSYAYNVMLGFTQGSNPGGNPACGGSGAVSLGTSAKGANEYNFGALPYVQGSSQTPDLHLAGTAGSTPADNVVVPGTGDFGLLNDIDATGTRPHDPNRDAGSDER